MSVSKVNNHIWKLSCANVFNPCIIWVRGLGKYFPPSLHCWLWNGKLRPELLFRGEPFQAKLSKLLLKSSLYHLIIILCASCWFCKYSIFCLWTRESNHTYVNKYLLKLTFVWQKCSPGTQPMQSQAFITQFCLRLSFYIEGSFSFGGITIGSIFQWVAHFSLTDKLIAELSWSIYWTVFQP